ncbi:MAG: hypothetical protein QXL57_09205 [Candidatus Bathyarchaeia archaeon]
MRRLLFISAIMFVAIIIIIPSVSACSCGCVHTIKVIPIGSTETGEPLITINPADLMIFYTGQGPIKNVWLLIVINEPTYNAINKITINGAPFIYKSDFQLVTTQKIPPTLPNATTGYPGSLCQYNVAAIKDKIKEKGNPIYYAVKFFTNQIYKTPTNFTLSVELESPANLKALVLALGRIDKTYNCCYETNCITYKPFNACTSFSNSTFVVPEVATLALASAPFLGAGGFYLIKRRRKLE